MNTKALRQKILDLAIHGKLVPQDPNDEPASVLLERIRDEKERLIKEGKIKRPKKSKATSDKPHYPYELPEGWVWCKLYDIVEFIGGYAYKSNTYVSKSDYQVVRIGNVKNDFLNLENLPVFVPETIGNQTDKYRIYENDILFTMTGTKGKRDYFFTTVVKKQERILLLNQRVGCLRSFSTELNMNYLSMLLKGKYILDSIFSTETGNVSQGNIGSENTLNLFVALPPYVEQQRIVKKVNSFFDLLNVMEERKRNLQDCIHDIKVKILDLAIQGKLIPQDSTDEPACDLLKRINPKAKIISDNGHYQMLPEGWCECKLSDVCVFDNGYAFSSDNYNDCGIPLIRISNITNTGSIDLSSCVFIQDVPSNKFIVKSGDLLIAMSGATTGKMGVYLYEEDALLNQRVGNLKCTDAMLQQYRNYYMFAKSDYILKIAYGGAQPNISAKAILDIDVMLPPLNEQHRIVAKIEEIFAQLDAIETSL